MSYQGLARGLLSTLAIDVYPERERQPMLPSHRLAAFCGAGLLALGSVPVAQGEERLVRDLEGGSGRLSERQQHAFKTADVHKATVIAGDESKDVIRSGTEGRRFWAEPSAPDVNADHLQTVIGY